MPTRSDQPASQRAVRAYWDTHIHDLEITTHPPGSPGFFADLEQYHFEKLHHLPRLVPFDQYRGPPRAGGRMRSRHRSDSLRATRRTGRPASTSRRSSIALAAQNFAIEKLPADLAVADGEALPFRDRSFDLVYAHGVVQYTTDDRALVRECRRVLKPGGPGGVSGVQPHLVAERAVAGDEGRSRARRCAVLKKYSIGEFRDLLKDFSRVRIVPERFPVKTRLHGGLKGTLYNTFFVGLFNAMPRSLTRRFGWHLLAFCEV